MEGLIGVSIVIVMISIYLIFKKSKMVQILDIRLVVTNYTK